MACEQNLYSYEGEVKTVVKINSDFFNNVFVHAESAGGASFLKGTISLYSDDALHGVK